ncbi:unnamed protein product [Periconia digitata]|uniref:NAD(P)-binding protein n=1 Tax=Periconia digitata TaxID=1303443 RepID=A0A9W4U359_9PLEO|nr:unnamed protein product [Periconia digitata]
MPGRLTHKTAIVTGSASGIGRAIALLFAAEGANIVVSDIREAPLEGGEDTVAEVQKIISKNKDSGKGDEEGRKQGVIFIQCDTTSASQVENLVQQTVEKFGRLDIMINNAGVGELAPGPIYDYPEEAFQKCLSVNVTGVFHGIKYAARQMRAQDPLPPSSSSSSSSSSTTETEDKTSRGWIVNLASIVAMGAQPGAVGYTTSKHAVLGLTRTSAWDLSASLIHVNALCPGFTHTSMTKPYIVDNEAARDELRPMHPFKGFGDVRDVARAALFLSSEDAAWVTGVGLPVDGGYTAR